MVEFEQLEVEEQCELKTPDPRISLQTAFRCGDFARSDIGQDAAFETAESKCLDKFASTVQTRLHRRTETPWVHVTRRWN